MKFPNINELNIFVESSRGVWAGYEPPEDDDVDPLKNLLELKIRADEDYEDPIALKTGVADTRILGQWTEGGRLFIRQVDPLPLSVLSIIPAGFIPIR